MIDNFGESSTGEFDNGSKWKNRGRPDECTNDQDGQNWVEGYNEDMWCRHWPDGSWQIQSYGKNPSKEERHSSGAHSGTLQDGSTYEFVPNVSASLNKGDKITTGNGHHDEMNHNGERGNHGTEKGGGQYADSGSGGSAGGSGTTSGGGSKGGNARWSDGNMNMAAAGDAKMTAAGSMTMGRGDDGSGSARQYVSFGKDGSVTVASKGGGDVSIQVKDGTVKIAGAKGISIEGGDGDVTISSKSGQVSISGKTVNMAGKDGIKMSHPPGPTTYTAERNGVHEPQYSMNTGVNSNEFS